MIRSFFTKEKSWLVEWDKFLQSTERGLFNQTSIWLQSYEVYGFDFEVFIITENDVIVGGCALVFAKFSIFKFLIVPCGPVLIESQEHLVDSVINELKEYALNSNCCCFQINLPFIKEGATFHNYTIKNISSDSVYYSGLEGTKFKYVIPLLGMRLIDLSNKTYDEVAQDFSSNHKRNISKASLYDFKFEQATDEKSIAEAYECFVQNAQGKGYSLRSYESMKNTLHAYVSKDQGVIATCVYQNKIIGAIFVIKCGQRLTYINGGTLQDYQNLPVPFYLHNELIKYALQNGFKSYDLSVGGSDGVIRFKKGFGSELYCFENTRYWVFKPFRFKIFVLIEKRLKPYKQTVAKLLAIIKKVFR
jgi:lipid II:glycine glycyltransferase (peptidoglycan interpeptide bridge formation enzyme)